MRTTGNVAMEENKVKADKSRLVDVVDRWRRMEIIGDVDNKDAVDGQRRSGHGGQTLRRPCFVLVFISSRNENQIKDIKFKIKRMYDVSHSHRL